MAAMSGHGDGRLRRFSTAVTVRGVRDEPAELSCDLVAGWLRRHWAVAPVEVGYALRTRKAARRRGLRPGRLRPQERQFTAAGLLQPQRPAGTRRVRGDAVGWTIRCCTRRSGSDPAIARSGKA